MSKKLKLAFLVWLFVNLALVAFGRQEPIVAVNNGKANIDLLNAIITAVTSISVVVLPVWITKYYENRIKKRQ